jgi:hypothetical protein
MKYKLDTNTPIPPPGAARPVKRLSLVETMLDMPVDTNTSFLIPLNASGGVSKATRKPGGVRAEVYAAAKQIREDYPQRRYVTRLVLKEKGVRVWRTA